MAILRTICWALLFILKLRFSKLLFGLAPSPFLLQGVIETHLDTWSRRYPDEVEQLHRSMYVDDLLTRGSTVEQAGAHKKAAQEILQDAKFELYKWNSNIPLLEAEDRQQLPEELEEQSYTKQVMAKPRESKVLGLKLDKETP